MKIVDSSISMTSQHSLAKTTIKTETSKFGFDFKKLINGDVRNGHEARSNAETYYGPPQVIAYIPGIKIEGTRFHQTKNWDQLSDSDKQKILALERILSSLTGKQVHFVMQKNNATYFQVTSAKNESQMVAFQQTVEKTHDRLYQENEKLSFTAQGIFKTADGKEIQFDTQFNYDRQFATLNNINLNTGEKLVDPLVINFAGPAASLTNTKYNFDIDSDGKAELMSLVDQGSGFLALDANKDGTVNNGSELFGVKSGDGFKDLAAYDSDHNGWIDENDPIFKNLEIWTKDREGKDQLFDLGQKGVGAIYLGNVEAQFGFKNEANQTLGQNQLAGIFARDDGTVGTTQEVDLTIQRA
jgi:hypothetical protein